MMALGHGRSYGKRSSVPGRTLPGILESELWSDLTARPKLPTIALITDVGNDLLYGVTPERLLNWVADCVERLQQSGARVTITGLPIGSLENLGSLRYRLYRTLLFPLCRLSLEEIGRSAIEVDAGLKNLASSEDRFVRLASEWYGFDPIHFRFRAAKKAWQALFAASFSKKSQKNFPSLSLVENVSLQLAKPAERTLLGVRQTCAQPVRTLSDGTIVSLY